MVSTTRRGLLAAGAGALLAAGCGAPDEPPPDAELLGGCWCWRRRSPAPTARSAAASGAALRSRARSHAERLRQAGAAGRGPTPPAEGAPLEAALSLERRALAAGLAAVGDLRDDGRRELAATVMTAAAQHESLLLARLGRDPLATAFPDGRAA